MALTGGRKTIFLVGSNLIALGTILHIVGLATPKWDQFGVVSVGLWEVCSDVSVVGCVTIDTRGASDSLLACRAFALLAMIFGVVSVALSFLFIYQQARGGDPNKLFPMLSAAFAISTVVCIIVCVIIWMSKQHIANADMGYSFILTCLGGILVLAGAILSFVSCRGTGYQVIG